MRDRLHLRPGERAPPAEVVRMALGEDDRPDVERPPDRLLEALAWRAPW